MVVGLVEDLILYQVVGPGPGPGPVSVEQAVLSTDDVGGELVVVEDLVLVLVLVQAQSQECRPCSPRTMCEENW